IEAVAHMLMHRPRYADRAGGTQGLQPHGDHNAVAVQVGSLGNDVADLDADPEPDPPGWLAMALRGDQAALDRHRKAGGHGDAPESQEEGVARGLHQPALMGGNL